MRTRHFRKVLPRDCGARVWSWALGPDEGAHFSSWSAGLRSEFDPDLFLVCTLSHHKQTCSIIRSGSALPNLLHEHAESGAKGSLA